MTQTESSDARHVHHHHSEHTHHSEYAHRSEHQHFRRSSEMDSAEAFKYHQITMTRRRKLFVRVLYHAMIALAILVVLAVVYVYTN